MLIYRLFLSKCKHAKDCICLNFNHRKSSLYLCNRYSLLLIFSHSIGFNSHDNWGGASHSSGRVLPRSWFQFRDGSISRMGGSNWWRGGTSGARCGVCGAGSGRWCEQWAECYGSAISRVGARCFLLLETDNVPTELVHPLGGQPISFMTYTHTNIHTVWR